MGTDWAYGGGCALPDLFRGHRLSLRRRLCPSRSFSWAQIELTAVSVPFSLFSMGTDWVHGSVCALLALFCGHSLSLRRCLCPSRSFSWAQI